MLEYIQAILNKRDPHTTEAKLDHAIEDSTLMPPAEIVADTIVLPEMSFVPPQDVPLPTVLADDLHDFVSEIARLHAPSAAFGNFEHASHVTLAAHKLLGQIQDDDADEREELQRRAELLHRRWRMDGAYLPPPTRGSLASLAPALLVEPPEGLEVGYVPICTRQGYPEERSR